MNINDYNKCHDNNNTNNIYDNNDSNMFRNDINGNAINYGIDDDDVILRLRDWDWDKFIQHKMTLYRCMISDIHDSSYVLFSTNLISNTSLHVGRPLLRPCLVAYAEATLARQKDSATNEKCWHHFRILIVHKWSVVWKECKNREFLLTGWKSLRSNVRVGKTCIRSWFLVSVSYKLLLYWNIDRK